MFDRYTSEDFEDAISLATQAGVRAIPYVYDAIAFAALRIASRVAQPRLLELELAGLRLLDADLLAEHLRSALMDEEET